MEKKTTEEIGEVLEAVWTLGEQGFATVDMVASSAKTKVSSELLKRLESEKFLSVDDSGRIKLLAEGRQIAERIIRRHRLAERLLCDVLGYQVEDSEAAACEYEHVLAEGITNSICTLLGHPRYCPHNKPIPEGECCRLASRALSPIAVSCDQLQVGESARIAYFSTKEHSRLLKLSALGITPGVTLKLIQKWPACVVQCEETEIAFEPDVARNIYVWQTPKE
jgi:DtxR family Mn-dependent transcriptional regulator